MSLFGWIKSGKKDENVNIVKIQDETVELGEMASVTPLAATQKISRMMDQQKISAKILVVEDGSYSKSVTTYALKMAQRLDCEIISLDVSEEPLKFKGERRENEKAIFFAKAEKAVSSFAIKAEKMGITFTHMMEVGDSEKVIAQLSSQDAGIRYVLTEPEESMTNMDSDEVTIPVFDLACSRI